jgi:hypothetical protein
MSESSEDESEKVLGFCVDGDPNALSQEAQEEAERLDNIPLKGSHEDDDDEEEEEGGSDSSDEDDDSEDGNKKPPAAALRYKLVGLSIVSNSKL